MVLKLMLVTHFRQWKSVDVLKSSVFDLLTLLLLNFEKENPNGLRLTWWSLLKKLVFSVNFVLKIFS